MPRRSRSHRASLDPPDRGPDARVREVRKRRFHLVARAGRSRTFAREALIDEQHRRVDGQSRRILRRSLFGGRNLRRPTGFEQVIADEPHAFSFPVQPFPQQRIDYIAHEPGRKQREHLVRIANDRQQPLQIVDAPCAHTMRLEFTAEFRIFGESRTDQRAVLRMVRIAVFARLDGIGIGHVETPSLTFEHDAVPERSQLRVGVSVGRVVAADVRRRKTQMRERVAHREFERRRIAAPHRFGQPIANGLRLRRKWRHARRIDRRPRIGRLVDAEASIDVLHDCRPMPVSARPHDVFEQRGVHVLRLRPRRNEAPGQRLLENRFGIARDAILQNGEGRLQDVPVMFDRLAVSRRCARR